MQAPAPVAIVAALRAYDPGHDLARLRQQGGDLPLIELGSNENAFGAGAAALAVIRGASRDTVRRYPDPRGGELLHALSAHHAIDPACIALGNGSHELLMLLAQAFAAAGSEVLYSQFGFAVYAIAAASAGAQGTSAAALPQDHPVAPRGHDLEAMAAALTPATRLVYLANPNNPTGTAFSVEAFEQWMRRVPPQVLVVVDEAYVEYADDPDIASVRPLLEVFPNLALTRTFSKIHGLAGLRIGYLLAHPRVTATIDRLRETFNTSAVAQAAAVAALADLEHLERSRRGNLIQRQRLTAELRQLGLFVPDSAGNFVLADFTNAGRSANEVETALLKANVVVRPMAGYGLTECLRITVGTEPEQERLLAAMASALA